MNRTRLPLILLMAGGLLAPSTAFSQTTEAPGELTVATAEMPTTTPTVAAEPWPAATSVAQRLQPSAASATLLAPMEARLPLHRDAPQQIEVDVDDDGDDAGVPLMVAGGILFVAGAIAGGDAGTILMLGGAAAGAYGAFVYFGGD